MKVIILDKKTYEFKEELDISKDYQIVLDIVLNQNSYFVTNHTKSISSIGDIIILHERSFFYIGVITNIELTDFGEIKLTSIDYISSLDFEINALEFNGNIGDELIRYIKEEYVENHDEHQNRPYLTLLNELDIVGKITVEDNKLTKFSDFLRDVYKQYKIRLEARLGILNGVITHLKIVTIDSRNEHILSSNFPMIRGLSISDNKEVNLNKITFIPNTDNVIHKTKESFYLLEDNTITDDKNAEGRIVDVVEKKKFYKDNDIKGNIYTHVFTSGQIKTSAGTITLSNISWYQTAATYVGFDGSGSKRGVQIGSAMNPNTNVFSLSTAISNFGNNIKITQVKVTLATVSVQNEYNLQAGNASTGYKNITQTQNKEYTTDRINEINGYVYIRLKAEIGAMYISKIEISYQDLDTEMGTLYDLASKELLKEDYMHNINFSITRDNQVFVPLEKVKLGDKVLFIHGDKRWATILSRIELNGTIKDFLITLGEQRIKLTEKLKIILEGK